MQKVYILPEESEYIRSLIRQEIRRMERKIVKLTEKFGRDSETDNHSRRIALLENCYERFGGTVSKISNRKGKSGN